MDVNPQTAVIDTGVIYYNNSKLLEASSNLKKNTNYKWKEIAFIPQSAMNSLDPVYRIIDQMREILIKRGNLNKKDADEKSEELFALVGIDKK